jgi:cadmium resistance protein CadD (predicted permease)
VTPSQLATAVAAFARTTVDDLVILAAFHGPPHDREPWRPGDHRRQYAGTAAILAIALITAAGLRIVPDRRAGLLGPVPIGFSARRPWGLHGTGETSRPPLVTTVTRNATIDPKTRG